MKFLLQILGLVIILIGITLLVAPDIIINWMENRLEKKSLYRLAIGVRIVFGMLLLFVASRSKFPMVLRFFGVVSILAAIFFLFLGHQGFIELLTTMLPKIKSFAWLSGLVGIGLGGLLLYSFWGVQKGREI